VSLDYTEWKARRLEEDPRSGRVWAAFLTMLWGALVALGVAALQQIVGREWVVPFLAGAIASWKASDMFATLRNEDMQWLRRYRAEQEGKQE
jgi:hypothetical protein